MKGFFSFFSKSSSAKSKTAEAGRTWSSDSAVSGDDTGLTTASEVQVLPWPEGRFEEVKVLQQAARNKGQVVLMRDTEAQSPGMSLVAVKQMPNTWVMRNQSEFKKARPQESENPWTDFEVTKLLTSPPAGGDNKPVGLEYVGVFRDDTWTYFIMGFAAGGDLFSKLQDWEGLQLDLSTGREARAMPIALNLLRKIATMHELGIAHRDVSLENVMIATEGEGEEGFDAEEAVRLIDFGMSTRARRSGDIVAKASYQAPEIHAGEGYDPALVDSFAVGVTIYNITIGNYPWLSTAPGQCKFWDYTQAKGFGAMLRKRKQSGRPLISWLSEPLMQILEGLLQPDPQNRLSVAKAANMLGEVIGTPAMELKDCC